MEIGEVIRKYRKEKQMTQEAMASYLGVTAPAVNKWENGNSLPDVALLAPIARLLDISTDTLLSYREELTEQEIDRLLQHIGEKVEQEGYDRAFQWTEEKIREYPNCIRLIFHAAQLLDSYRLIYGIEDSEKVKAKIYSWYVRSLNSPDQKTVQTAAVSLMQYHMAQKEYEKAQEYLDRLPEQGFNPKQLQANLYLCQEKYGEAYSLYEHILLAGFNELNGALNGIVCLAMKDNDRAKAEKAVSIQSELARLLEMGRYMEITPGLELAFQSGDKEAVLEKLSDMAEHLGDMDAFRRSELYAHVAFSDTGTRNVIRMLQKGLENDESLAFIRDDERYVRFLEKVESLAEQKDV